MSKREEFQRWNKLQGYETAELQAALTAWQARGEHDRKELEQLRIDNADLHANLAESNSWLADANKELDERARLMLELTQAGCRLTDELEAAKQRIAEHQAWRLSLVEMDNRGKPDDFIVECLVIDQTTGTEELERLIAKGKQAGRDEVMKEMSEIEPVAHVVSSGPLANLPCLEWMSANHSCDAPIGSMLIIRQTYNPTDKKG